MGGSIYLNFSGILYTLLIAFFFFCKKKLKSKETIIYGVLVIVTLLELASGVISSYAIVYTTNSLILNLTVKAYFIFMLLWLTLFTLYTLGISKNSTDETKKKNTIIISIITIIFAILIAISPANFYNNDGQIFSDGLSAAFLVLGSLVLIVISLISTIRNRKSLDKRYIPLAVFVILGIVAMIIQVINPQLFLVVPFEVFITSVMYNTIENPDVKLIKELQMARDLADKANRAKSDFLSSMSHEIRTPLNAIVGFSDYIMTSNSLEEAKENAKDIVNASQTLLEIVNGILDISKIEAGKIEITNSNYNSRETFESLAKLITPKMQDKGLDFSYYIAPDIPDILFGNQQNIKKIITNLLSNACKYTSKGFVRYEVNCVNAGDVTKLIITVEDSGRGIKPENVDKLFTKFQRLDEDRNTTMEGTGLGLAITKQLVELMGGKILVHTVYGEGSKFTVILNQRIETDESMLVAPIPVSTTLDLKGKKILLIDDNELNIKVTNKILGRYNADNITSLNNGFDCLEKIKAGEVYDVILLDDMMPKMSGPETLKELKKIPGFNQPVVVLTANAITGMKEKYLQDGFDEYLAKPIEKEELIRVLNSIFEKNHTTPVQPQPVQPQPAIVAEEPKEKPIAVEEVQKVEPITPLEEPKIVKNISQPAEEFLKSSGVDLAKALESLGDIEMYNMTVSDFLAEVENKWNNIVNYKNTNDMANYAIEVHSLKSDSKYLGLMNLAEVAYEHELKSKENNITFVNENFARLELEYKKALEIIKKYNEMLK